MSCGLRATTLHELRQQRKDNEDLYATERRFAAALDATDLDSEEAAILAVVQRVYREERSSDTPIEKFIIEGLLRGLMYRPLTLDDVLQDLDELRIDWRDALQTARTFYVQHRDLVTRPESDPEEESDGGDTTC